MGFLERVSIVCGGGGVKDVRHLVQVRLGAIEATVDEVQGLLFVFLHVQRFFLPG